MKLEDQLATLAELGLKLEDGVTVDDVLYSFDRSEYEAEPFDLVLFIFGVEVEREPWGRPFCSRALNLDFECITGTGDYVGIAERLCAVAGKPGRLEDVRDFVDIDAGLGWLKYRVDGVERDITLKVDSDWADPAAVEQMLRDLEGDGRRFYAKDNGQAMILFLLDEPTAAELNGITGGALTLAAP